MESRGAGLFDESERGIRYGLALNDGFGERCWIADKSGVNGGQIMAYAGTASVARDMVEVADKIAQLRSRQRGSGDKPNDTTNGSKTLEDVARVQYVGFSYGTILGHYFASMFPERVGRLVLDGVMDPNDYATGPVCCTILFFSVVALLLSHGAFGTTFTHPSY
jgi:pimeloyl-ACP methyl ester carboxylesterase